MTSTWHFVKSSNNSKVFKFSAISISSTKIFLSLWTVKTLSRLEGIKRNFLRFFFDTIVIRIQIFPPWYCSERKIIDQCYKTRSTSITIERAGVNSLHGTSDARDHKREIGPRGSADASIKSRSYYYRLFHSLSLTNFPSLSSTFSPRFVSSPPVLERDLSRHTCCIFRLARQRGPTTRAFLLFLFLLLLLRLAPTYLHRGGQGEPSIPLLSLSLYLYFSALTLSRFKSINRFLRNDPPPSFLSPEERREGAARFVTVTPHQRHNLRGYKTIKIEEDFIDARSPHNLFYYDRPSVGRRYPSQVNTLSVYEAARIRRVITERRGSVVEREKERERRGRRRRVIDSRYLNVSIKPALTHANFDPRLRCRNEASIFSDSQPVYKYFFRRRVSRIEWISDRETES